MYNYDCYGYVYSSYVFIFRIPGADLDYYEDVSEVMHHEISISGEEADVKNLDDNFEDQPVALVPTQIYAREVPVRKV